VTGGRRRPGRPPAAEAGDTRERLLEVALELFARHGFAGTSVRAIAGAAGLSDAGLYSHFPGKQAIYDELFRRAGPVSLDALGLDAEELAALPLAEAVAAIVRALVWSWERPVARAFTSVLLREGGPSGSLAAEVALARARLEPLFAQWIACGAIPDDHDPAELVWELFTPLVALRFLHLRADAGAEDLSTARALAERHCAFILHAVQTPRRSPRPDLRQQAEPLATPRTTRV
jgi:AcrR family transcriptional regulator